MYPAGEPTDIRVRLGGQAVPSEPVDPALRQLVDEMVRRAYPRTRVIVSLDPALREDLVVVVGVEGDRHGDAVRKLVAYARVRIRRGTS